MNDLTERLRRAGALLDDASEQRGKRTSPSAAQTPPDAQEAGRPSTAEPGGPYVGSRSPVHGSSWRLRIAMAAAAVVLIGVGIYLRTDRVQSHLQPTSNEAITVVPKVHHNGVTTVLRLAAPNVELWISPNTALPKEGTCGVDLARGSTSQQCGRYGDNEVSGLFRGTDLPDGTTKASRYLQIINLDRRISRLEVKDGDRTMYEAPVAGAALFPLRAPWPDPGFTITATDRKNTIIWTQHPD